jgi:hypothetical protein
MSPHTNPNPNNIITKQTPVTLGMLFLIIGISGGAIFKAGQVLTEFEVVKVQMGEMRQELREIKSFLVRGNRVPSGPDNQ